MQMEADRSGITATLDRPQQRRQTCTPADQHPLCQHHATEAIVNHGQQGPEMIEIELAQLVNRL